MFPQRTLLEIIGFKLSHLKACVETLNKIHFFDLNVVAEDFFASLLNEIYGYKLVNLNHSDLNAVAIDLADQSRKIGIQITSERTKAKIQKTIDKFVSHRLQDRFDSLKVLIIGDRTGDYPTLNVPSEISFDGQVDVMDIDSLMSDIRKLDEGQLQRIADLVRREIVDHFGAPQSNSLLLRLQSLDSRDRLTQRRSVGQGFVVHRSGLLQKIDTAIESTPNEVLIIGDSGCGKSALAATAVEEWSKKHSSFFLSADSAICFADSIGNSTDLKSVVVGLADRSNARPIVVIDGIDRLRGESIRTLSRFILDIRNTNRCCLALTCQKEHVNRVVRTLHDQNCSIGKVQVEVGGFTPKELKQVIAALPRLAKLLSRPGLPSLYRRPFVIDALVQVAHATETDLERPVGESKLVEWIWTNRISEDAGTNVSRLLMELGRQQADAGDASTSEALIHDGNAADSAVEHSFLVRDGSNFQFAHDMYGDWARFRVLETQGNNLPRFLDERAENPIWHRAIRLMGSHQMEQVDGTNKWKKLLQASRRVKGLLLDALLFSVEPLILLEKAQGVLFENDGAFLKILIRRALVGCTLPSLYTQREEANGKNVPPFLRVYQRDPKPFHETFGALLQFLRRNLDQTVGVVPHEASLWASRWLEMTPKDWPYRAVAAEIVVAVATDIVNDGRTWDRDRDEMTTDVFKALLWAFEQSPEETRPILLSAAGLDPNCQQAKREEQEARDDAECRGWVVQERSAWSDGPSYDPHLSLRRACWYGDSMWPVFTTDPTFGEKLILALAIKVRTSDFDDRGGMFGRGLNENGLVRTHNTIGTSHYLHGPYLKALQTGLFAGAKLITKLSNFCSWRSVHPNSHDELNAQSEVISPIDRTSPWYGDETSFWWNRGLVEGCRPIVPALTALEKCLGDLIEEGKDVQPVLETILADCRSVALAGVLFDVGRRHPALFSSALRPLLMSPILLIWAESMSSPNYQPWSFGPTTELGPAFFEEHQKWLSAEYRRHPISQLARQNAVGEIQWTTVDNSVVNATDWADDVSFLQQLPSIAAGRQPGAVLVPPVHSQSNRRSESGSTTEDPIEAAIQTGWLIHRLLLQDAPLPVEVLESTEPDREDEVTDHLEHDLHLLRENNYFGEKIFLLLHHKEWLQKNELEKSYLTAVIHESTNRLMAGSEAVNQSGGFPSFLSFAGRLAVERLASDVSSTVYRQWVVQLITMGHQSCYSGIIRAVWANAARLGCWTTRILQTVLQSAAAIWESEAAPLYGRDVNPDFDRHQWAKSLAAEFVAGTTPPTIPKPSDIYISSPSLRYANWRNPGYADGENDIFYMQQPIEESVLHILVDNTPCLSAVPDEDDRSTVVQVIEFALTVKLKMIEAYGQNGEKLTVPNEEYPTMTGQHLLLTRIAAEVVCADSLPDCQRLLEPILALGLTSPHWIEFILSKLMWPRLSEPDLPPSFEITWAHMIDFVSKHPNWHADSHDGRQQLQRNKLVAKLLGVDDSYYDLWHESHSDVVRRLKSKLAPLLRQVLQFSPTSAPAIQWITNGLGKEFLTDALKWLDEAELNLETDGPEARIVTALADFLCAVYSNNAAFIRGDFRNQFNRLCLQAAQTNNAVAIDLNQRTAGL